MSIHEDGSTEGPKMQRGLAFLHQARKVRELDSTRVERIARRLRRPVAPRARRLLWPALAAVLLALVAGAGLAAAHGGLSRLPFVQSLLGLSSTHDVPAPPAPRRPASPMAAPAVPAEGAVPSTSPTLSSSPIGGRRSDPSPTGVAPASTHRDRPKHARFRDASSAVAGAEPIARAPVERDQAAILAESQDFAEVIKSWRGQHNGDVALALLDAFDARYPRGHMQLEARVLRAEIYLARNRGDAALAVLDAVPLSGLPRARELKTVRGELRVKAGRCSEARADLGSVLDAGLTDALAKRAGRALASCP